MKTKILRILLGFLIYLVVFSSFPYIRQKNVSNKFKNDFDISRFYKKDGSCTYAQIIRENDKARIEKIRAIDNAQDKIMLSNYRFLIDNTGEKFMASLVAAAKRGVDIDIILDGNTLFMNLGKNNYYLALDSFPNVHMKIYNPMSLLKPRSLMGRMHDKYMIVDDEIAFVGGRNIADRFMQTTGKYTYDWDVLLYCDKRSKNDAIGQLKKYFYDIYDNGQRNKDIKKAAIFANDRKNKEILDNLKTIYENDKINNLDNYKNRDYPNTLIKVSRVNLIANPINVYSKEPQVFYQIIELMKNANKSVDIHTPYFIGNKLMYDSLKDISKKVPTRLFTNSPASGVNTAGNGEYIVHKNKIKNLGVNLLENEKDFSYHGKAFTIDDNLSAVGSFNWDMRSTYIDTELMLVIEGEEFSKKVKDEFSFYEKDANKVLENGDKINLAGKKMTKASFVKKFISIMFIILFYPLRFLF